MIIGYYKCECGKEFTNPQSFNGHKSHCYEHFKSIGKIAEFKKKLENDRIQLNKNRHVIKQLNEEKKKTQMNKWIAEQHRCEHCKKIMNIKYGSGRFCCKSCANAKRHTEATKKKISISVKKSNKNNKNKYIIINGKHYLKKSYEKYMESPSTCVICGKKLSYIQRNYQTCSVICKNKLNSQKQRSNPRKTVIRSKNEIFFYDLCIKSFDNVLHNVAMFNGWDADIILPDLKYAILWNGPWHYKQIVNGQSLKQIQTRDKLKLKAIKECGYTPYIIKDMGKYNPKFVQKQFEIFLQTINEIIK